MRIGPITNNVYGNLVWEVATPVANLYLLISVIVGSNTLYHDHFCNIKHFTNAIANGTWQWQSVMFENTHHLVLYSYPIIQDFSVSPLHQTKSTRDILLTLIKTIIYTINATPVSQYKKNK